MKDYRSLKVLDRFKGFFEKIGVDYEVMRKILFVKFTLDARRVPTIMKNNKKKENKKDKNQFINSLWIYTLMGFFFIFIIVFGKNYFVQMSIIFGMMFFMIMSTLIADFSTVLLDVRDKSIMLVRPINKKTLNMAKIVHILIYMFLITASLVIIPLIAGTIRHGIVFGLLFIVGIIWMDLLVIVLAALFYMMVLKYFDGEKLKDIINYSQIILTVSISIGYQLIGRLFSITGTAAVFNPKWWQYLIIPVWFAAPFEMILNHTVNIHLVIFSLLAFIVPIGLMIFYIRSIPVFERNLQKLSRVGGKVRVRSFSLIKTIGKWITRSQDEFVMFCFSVEMFKSEREFKLKTFPSIGMAIVLPMIFIFNMSTGSPINEVRQSKMYLAIYLTALLLPTLIMMVQYSEKYKGSWVYYVLPIEDKVALHKGALKAIVVQFMLPIYAIVTVLSLWFFGMRIAIDLAIIFISMMIYAATFYRIANGKLPFSVQFAVGNQSGTGVQVMLGMIVFGILAGVQFGLTYVPYGRISYLFAALIIMYLVWNHALKSIKVVSE